jgi:hypothetical protein
LGAEVKNMSKIKSEPSANYRAFYDHVFGDYRNFYYNGLSEDLFAQLDESERIEAEKIVLRAIRKLFIDERAIRAAGYLKIQDAIPVLEKRLRLLTIFLREETHSAIVWALLKIKHDKQQLSELVRVASGSTKLKGLKRVDAIELISDFGEEPLVVKALLQAFLDKDYIVSASAQYALQKIFKDDQYISDLFKSQGFAPPFYVRDSIVKHIELQIQM